MGFYTTFADVDACLNLFFCIFVIRNKALEKDPGVLKKGQDVVVSAASSTSDYVVKKRLLERGTQEIGGRVCWALEKVVGGKDKNADPYTG